MDDNKTEWFGSEEAATKFAIDNGVDVNTIEHVGVVYGVTISDENRQAEVDVDVEPDNPNPSGFGVGRY